jgi:hypothetical protein
MLLLLLLLLLLLRLLTAVASAVMGRTWLKGAAAACDPQEEPSKKTFEEGEGRSKGWGLRNGNLLPEKRSKVVI